MPSCTAVDCGWLHTAHPLTLVSGLSGFLGLQVPPVIQPLFFTLFFVASLFYIYLGLLCFSSSFSSTVFSPLPVPLQS